MTRFAEWLLHAVKESEYTRQEIADHIGVSKPAVDIWLGDKGYPKVVPLFRLCSLLWPSDRDGQYLVATGILERESP